MGELIEFKLPAAAALRRRGRGAPAAILFFTGVRREVMGDSAAHTPPALTSGEGAGKPSRKTRSAAESGA
jgi:hypothetical protein